VDLQRVLSSRGFMRLVLVVWIICTVFLVFLFKSMEQIVHVQLYDYGLVLDHSWLDPFRLCSSLIYYGCLLPPLVLSGVVLMSSFIAGRKMNAVSRRPMQPQAAKVQPRPVVREAPKTSQSGKRNAIACPNCKKVFSRALVMLDFRGGKNRMVSVCPYCNYVLGTARDERGLDENFHVAQPEEKIIR
jgi:hypothetical protein